MALVQLGMADCLEGIDPVLVRDHHIYHREEGDTFWYPSVPVEGKNAASSANLEKERDGEWREKRIPEGRSFHPGEFVVKLRDTEQRAQHDHVGDNCDGARLG